MMSLDTIDSPVPSDVTLKSCAETDCDKKVVDLQLQPMSLAIENCILAL